MKVHPATKNGYRLKKSSMVTRTVSKLILPASESTRVGAEGSTARDGNGVKRLIKESERIGFLKRFFLVEEEDARG